jgi:hypothetical protein
MRSSFRKACLLCFRATSRVDFKHFLVVQIKPKAQFRQARCAAQSLERLHQQQPSATPTDTLPPPARTTPRQAAACSTGGRAASVLLR